MRIAKFILKILLIIFVTSVLSTLLMQVLRSIFYDDSNYYSTSQDIKLLFFGNLASTAIALIIYWIAHSSVRNKPAYIQGFVCLFASLLFYVFICLITFGLTVEAIIYLISSIGLSDFLIPYFDLLLNRLMSIDAYQSS